MLNKKINAAAIFDDVFKLYGFRVTLLRSLQLPKKDKNDKNEDVIKETHTD